ncbi:MAG: curli production assembly protein CsgG, partial [Zetaproteobacteria bacterium]
TCDQAKIPATLKISDQVQQDKAWGVIEGDGISRAKLGQIVERTDISGALF